LSGRGCETVERPNGSREAGSRSGRVRFQKVVSKSGAFAEGLWVRNPSPSVNRLSRPVNPRAVAERLGLNPIDVLGLTR
jgi:hypothetical protein